MMAASWAVWGQGGPRESAMTRGWDGWGAPLAGGKVSWQATDLRNGRYAFRATYQVQGAEPNHQYQVGVHFFEPAGTTRAVVREFGGLRMPGDRGPLAREGVTATYVGGFEFGMLSTDGRGERNRGV